MTTLGYNLMRITCAAHKLNTIAKKCLNTEPVKAIWLNTKRISQHFHQSTKSTALLISAQPAHPKYTLPGFSKTRFLSAEPVRSLLLSPV